MSVVVALGPVDRPIVEKHLGVDHVLVSDPSAADLAVAEGAIVRGNVTVDRAVFDSMPRLRVLARTGVGTELVDLDVARERSIPVVITPGSNTNAVAEGALAMMLHLTKNLAALTELVRDGRWNERERHPLGDIDGSTIGIVGWGRIGQRLGALAHALGATVRSYDPVASIPTDIRADSLAELLAISDVVSLHAPLMDSTRHMINDESLAVIKPRAILINCGRGPLMDIDAVHRALVSGQLSGVGLDVFDEEPPAMHPIMLDPRVVMTPHVMGLTQKAAAQTYADAAVGIRAVLEGKAPAATAF
jgi:phosphoglycerate dehydrogenase-like enzyme